MAGTQRTATATWQGDLESGRGTVRPGSSAFGELPVDWQARTEGSQTETSPEELIAAAHASCFAMAFSNTLAQAGHTPESVEVNASVTFTPVPAGGYKVESSTLSVTGRVPGLTQEQFTDFAKQGDQGCPVSNALRGNVAITVEARLA